MPSTQRRIDETDAAPIAPDIIPADWADCVPRAANDATSREKLFAEIRHAAETAAPAVDTTFRASDVSDNPAQKSRARFRARFNRALSVFAFALISAFAAAAWEIHGDTAKQVLANWVTLPAPNASSAAEPAGESTRQPAEQQPTAAASTSPETASGAVLPVEVEQQLQTMARDLAAMGQEIEQLKATIEALKASRQAAIAVPAPVARAPAAPPKPKVTAAPPRPAPAPQGPAHAALPAQAATMLQPAPAAAAPQVYPAQPAAQQPNGEPIVRPPMPLPLSDRY